MEEFKLQLKASVPSLMRYTLALLGHFRAAETMVQSCIEKALDNHHRWDKNKAIKPWLFSLLHLEYQAYQPLPEEAGIDASLAEFIMDNDPSIINNQQIHDLLKAINRLPKEPKEILLMVILGGLEYRQVSEILGLPIPKLMSQLHLARKLLRKYTTETKHTLTDDNS